MVRFKKPSSKSFLESHYAALVRRVSVPSVLDLTREPVAGYGTLQEACPKSFLESHYARQSVISGDSVTSRLAFRVKSAVLHVISLAQFLQPKVAAQSAWRSSPLCQNRSILDESQAPRLVEANRIVPHCSDSAPARWIADSFARTGVSVPSHFVPVHEASTLQPAGCSHFDLLVFRVGFGRVVKVIHFNFASCIR